MKEQLGTKDALYIILNKSQDSYKEAKPCKQKGKALAFPFLFT